MGASALPLCEVFQESEAQNLLASALFQDSPTVEIRDPEPCWLSLRHRLTSWCKQIDSSGYR